MDETPIDPMKMKTFEYQMESFGYDIDFDKMTCGPVVLLYKLEAFSGYKRVYEYRATIFAYSNEHDNIESVECIQNLLIHAYWAYRDFCDLKDKYDNLKKEIQKLPKHMIIKRHMRNH